ncbi:MAG: hypothetical protein JXA67_00730 [Micromonosporaceae bacterium]|nr:hypothetical protein [Micromonosporaceae bacterium]
MIDRPALHRVTATMIRYELAAHSGHTVDGLADAEAWRHADRHLLSEHLAGRILAGTAHLHDLAVLRMFVDARWRDRWREAGQSSPPGAVPLRLPGLASPRAAGAALRAHADRLHLEEPELSRLVGRLVADLLHLLAAHDQSGEAVIVAALDTVLPETAEVADIAKRSASRPAGRVAADADGDADPHQLGGGHHG